MIRGRALGISWVLFFLLSASWALANPVGAAPDEPAHLVKAASVVRGEFEGPPSEYGQVVRVPRYVQFTFAQTCFAFKPDVPASCSPSQPFGDPFETVEASTTAGLYNPLYYVLVGWPTLLFTDGAGIYAMRVVSAALCSLFLAVSFVMICTWQKPALSILGFTTAITPMVVFLNSSVNPNALETVTVLAAFIGMLSIALHPRPELLLQRSIVVLTSSAVAVNTRGLSPVWVCIALLLPLLLIDRSSLARLLKIRVVQVTIACVAVASALALVWLRYSNSLGAAVDNPSDALMAPSVGASATSGFLATLDQTFGLARNMVGIFGWLDTPAPEVVFFVWSVFAGTLVLASVVLLRGRKLAFALTLCGAVLFLPPLLQGAYITGGGFIWQGRYTLPIFVCLMVGLSGLLAERLPSPAGSLVRRTSVTVVMLWAGSHVYAFAVNIKRYTAGADSTWADVLFRPDWTPPGGIGVWTGLFILAITSFSAYGISTIFRSIEDASTPGVTRAMPTPVKP